MRARVLSAVVAISAAVTLAACSSSGSGSAGDTGGVEAPTGSGGTNGTVLKVGVICSCTGPISKAAAPAGKVAQAWAKSVNAEGGLNGHPVELIFKDDGSDPGKAVTAAQDLISEDVDVVLNSSILSSAWAKAVTEAGIPVVGGDLSSHLYHTNPNFYPSGQTNDSIVMADVLTAKQAGAKTLAQFYCAESPTCQEGVKPHKDAGKKVGVPFVYTTSISQSAPNYTAQCLAAKQAGAEALFIGASPEVFARVATDCHRQGYDPIYIQEGTAFTMALAGTPALNNRYYGDFPILPFFVDKAPVQKMNAALDKYYPGLRKGADTFSMFAPQAWTAGLLIGKAIEAAAPGARDDISPKVVRKGLDSIENETLDGWSPPLTFTKGQTHSVDCWYTAQIKDGKPVLVNGGKLTCQNES